MPINFDSKKVFVHIPKNAGTSITKCWPGFVLEGHHDINYYKNELKFDFKNFETFCVIRDPIDRFISNFNYAKAKNSFWHSIDKNSIHGKHPDYDKLLHLTLDECARLLITNPSTFGIHWVPQVNWIQSNGKIIVQKVFNFENVEEEIFNNYGIKIETLNKIEKKETTMSGETKKLIESFYQKDYKFINHIRENIL